MIAADSRLKRDRAQRDGDGNLNAHEGEEDPESLFQRATNSTTRPLHSLRHSRAIDFVKKHRHVVYVRQFLRHSLLEVTREYLQVVPRPLHEKSWGWRRSVLIYELRPSGTA